MQYPNKSPLLSITSYTMAEAAAVFKSSLGMSCVVTCKRGRLAPDRQLICSAVILQAFLHIHRHRHSEKFCFCHEKQSAISQQHKHAPSLYRSMHASISRSHEDAAKDLEWPGPDTRKWKQTLISPLPLSGKKKATPTAEAMLLQTKLDVVWAGAGRDAQAAPAGLGASNASGASTRRCAAAGLTRPLSPSL